MPALRDLIGELRRRASEVPATSEGYQAIVDAIEEVLHG
jgi:hypothetical protein